MRFSKAASKSRAVRVDQGHALLKLRYKHKKGAPRASMGVLARVGGMFRKKSRLKTRPGEDALLGNAMGVKTTAHKQVRQADQAADRVLANRFGRKEKRLEKQALTPSGVGLGNRVE